MIRQVRFSGLAKVLPEKQVFSEELDARLGLEKGTLEKKTGVQTRHFLSGSESVLSLGAEAARKAVADAGLRLDEIDLIISGSSVPYQPIPCNAALLHRELGLEERAIPAFDINSTCLGFVTASDMVSHAIQAGVFRHVLIITSEAVSIALNWDHLESAGLFGDGAAAAVLSASDGRPGSGRFLATRMRTYSSGADLCRITGGLIRIPPQQYAQARPTDFLFEMDGPTVFREAIKHLPTEIDETLKAANLSMDEIALVVPHQASKTALRLVQRKLEIPDERWMEIFHDHGNTVSSSIPMALCEAVRQKRIRRGDKVLVFGTSAGLSIGTIVFEY